MRLILFIIASIFTGIAVGILGKSNKGFVIIDTGTTSIGMRLPLFVLLVLVTFLLLFLLLSLIKGVFGSKQRISGWFSRKKKQKAWDTFYNGLILLAEGNYKDAEKKLISSTTEDKSDAANYIAAAIAAHFAQNETAQKQHIANAGSSGKKARLATAFIDAMLNIHGKKYEQAIAKLKFYNEIKPNHPPVIRALYQCYKEVGDWDSISNLKNILIKNSILNKTELEEITVKADLISLDKAFLDGETSLKNCWQNLQRSSRSHPDAIKNYSELLCECGLPNEAEKLLRDAIPKEWDKKLIETYGTLKLAAPEKMLSQLESWLKKHPDNTTILLAAARQATSASIWGKAKSFYQAIINIKPTFTAYNELGKLFEQLDEQATAIDCFRKAIDMHN